MKIKLNQHIHCISSDTRLKLESDVINIILFKLGVKYISSKANLSKWTIPKYIRKKAYPISFLQLLNKFVEFDIFNLIENHNPTFISRSKIVKIPNKIMPSLSYFVGYLQGDGCIEGNKRRISFVDEYKNQIKKINLLSFNLFGTEGKITEQNTTISKKPAYKITICSKVLNHYLHHFFEINRGKKINLRIPKNIRNNKELLRSYLIGLFDADGTLPKNPEKCKQLFIDVTFKDKKFIEEIKESLITFGVTTLNPYCRIAKSPTSDFISKTWELRIRKRAEIIRFLKEIGFIHPDKEKRTKMLLKLVGQ